MLMLARSVAVALLSPMTVLCFVCSGVCASRLRRCTSIVSAHSTVLACALFVLIDVRFVYFGILHLLWVQPVVGGEASEGGSGRAMSTSWSSEAEACERVGSGGLGRPRWGVATAGGW